MALEAVVYQQDQLFTHSAKDFYALLGSNTWDHTTTTSFFDFPLPEFLDDAADSVNFLDNQTETSFHQYWTNSNSSPPDSSIYPHFTPILQNNPSPDHANNNANANGTDLPENHLDSSSPMPTRAKRRRSRSRKNKEEIENQRMTHIAVERNRRKQMNEYLSILRSLMPESYVQRGDQASIIGGAINFVKELEQRLQLVGGKKEMMEKCEGGADDHQIQASTKSLPFSEFFTFPQYSTSSAQCENSAVAGGSESVSSVTQSTVADIEVTMVESHASLKIRSKRRPKQLLKVVSGLHALRLTILHLNVSTVDQIVLYSLSVKVEDDCKLNSVDEIATAVYQMLGRIQEEYCMMN